MQFILLMYSFTKLTTLDEISVHKLLESFIVSVCDYFATLSFAL